MADLLAAGRMGPQRAAGLVGCLRLAEHVWSPLAVGQVGSQLAARGVPIAAPVVLIRLLHQHLPAPGLSIQSLQRHLAARWTLQPMHQHLPVPGMPCQSIVHWSKTTYPEVVFHGHGQHDFYVEHAQPELRLRILYTKISLTCSLELCGML